MGQFKKDDNDKKKKKWVRILIFQPNKIIGGFKYM